ncbi:MAG: hypothetical protein M1820_003301 [Bogoriella megaspora]|nr:MAG: hypothetical protein M1820_003301 [Bogoriella megaspora]
MWGRRLKAKLHSSDGPAFIDMGAKTKFLCIKGEFFTGAMLRRLVAPYLTLPLFAAALTPSTQQLGTLSILAVDNLVTDDAKNTSAALLINEAVSYSTANASCQSLSESLLPLQNLDFQAGLNQSLAYEVYAGRSASNQLFWVGPNTQLSSKNTTACPAIDAAGNVRGINCAEKLPALCSQSAPASNITYADTSARFQVAQKVGSQTLVGYRDFLTFRYLGIRFAAEPERFTYSSVYRGNGTSNALDPAPECLQLPNNGSTDCLFLNVWTTTLPSTSEPAKQNLKPVMVYIYGGGFTSGSASNPTNDGGNLAARGDVVVVDVAYRLSTLGFLPLKDGIHNGNYWLSDCIAGLQWVQENIEAFGGDPTRVTIFGESAGALSVQELIESPEAAGLFHGAILQSDYYEPSVSIDSAYNQSTIPILAATGCNTAEDQLACLQAYDAIQLLNLSTIANYPVIDGKYLTSAYFNFSSNSSIYKINSVPVMIGVNRDEGGVLAPYFETTDLDTGIRDIAASEGLNATAIISSGAFPLGDGPNPANQSLNVFNTTTRIYSDASFRCSSQGTVYAGVRSGKLPSVWFYEFNRTYQDPAYNMNGVCLPPATPNHPFGDPSLEYFKCHAGDLANTFGNVARVGFPARDENDLPFAALVVDYWTAFARNGDPNLDVEWLAARGYWSSVAQVGVSGSWPKVEVGSPQLLELQWNSFVRDFRDEEQCDVLGLGFSKFT